MVWNNRNIGKLGGDQWRNDPQGMSSFWREEIANAKNQQQRFFAQARRAWRAYRNELGTIGASAGVTSERGEENSGFGSNLPINIFNSNIEVMKSLVYSQSPIPMVRRRMGVDDPNARAAADIIQKTLAAQIDSDDFDFDEVLYRARNDFLIAARGMVEVSYKVYGKRQIMDPIPVRRIEGRWRTPDGEEVPAAMVDDKDGDEGVWTPVSEEQTLRESVCVDYIDPMDVLIQPARRWDEVQWVAMLEHPTKREIAERWGEEVANRVRYATRQDLGADGQQTIDEASGVVSGYERARIWRVYDKRNRRRVYIDDDGNDAEDAVIRIEADDLQLQGFLPFPKPIQTGESNRRLDPVPEFTQYESIYWMLQRMAVRWFGAIDSVRVLGFYSGRNQDIMETAFSANTDPKIIALTEGGDTDVRSIIDWLPTEGLANSSQLLAQVINETKNLTYEVSGISDLMRGMSHPRETATAQRHKVEFGSGRLAEKKRAMTRMIRETLRMMTEVMCLKFRWETFEHMSGVQLRSQQEIEQEIQQVQMEMEMAQQPPPMPGMEQGGMPPMPPPGGMAGPEGMPPEGPGAPPPPEPDPQMMAGLEARLNFLSNEASREATEELIRNDFLRDHSIDIEIDSTVAVDQEHERNTRAEMLQMLGQATQVIQPLTDVGALPQDMLPKLYSMFIRGMPMSRDLVSILEGHTVSPPPPPPPDPAEIKAESDRELEAMRLQHEAEQKELDRQHEEKMVRLKQESEETMVRMREASKAQQTQTQVQAQDSQSRIKAVTDMAREEIKSETAKETAKEQAKRQAAQPKKS